jgi:hypothetical protein
MFSYIPILFICLLSSSTVELVDFQLAREVSIFPEHYELGLYQRVFELRILERKARQYVIIIGIKKYRFRERV